MSEINITESGMKFKFDKQSFFRIEECPTLASMHERVEICEFVSLFNDDVIFVEAKSSFPDSKNPDDFEKNVASIVKKFQNSTQLFAAILVGRPFRVKTLLPEKLRPDSIKNCKWICYFIINGHEDEWLEDIDDEINARMNDLKKCFYIEQINVLNDKFAKELKLIC